MAVSRAAEHNPKTSLAGALWPAQFKKIGISSKKSSSVPTPRARGGIAVKYLKMASLCS